MHVIVFPGWYPDRVDNLSGDFIQRHLQAISLNCRVTVVIPIKQKGIKKLESETIKSGNLEEQYFYYPSHSSLRWLDAFFSFISYNYICLNAIKAANRSEKISIVHLYVLQKNVLTGLLCKWIYRIPYVISEQSTLYVDGRFEKLNRLQQQLMKNAFAHSASVHAVSAYLLNNIKNKLSHARETVIIPNVVDPALFHYKTHAVRKVTTFVHVSNMVYQKNVEGMLAAFAKVKELGKNFLLNLAGPMPPSVLALIQQLGLAEHVVVWNQVSYQQVAAIMQQSDAFVFFTRFETFGCVIAEANACGLPVVVSKLEVTKELITEGKNGLFVQSENIQDLRDKLLEIIDHKWSFNSEAIALQTPNKFGYEEISRQFLSWYKAVLKKR